MKKLIMMSKTAWICKFMVLSFCLFLGSVSGLANTGSRTFYYAVKASHTPTGAGKVYATTSSNAPAESSYQATYSTTGSAQGFHVGSTNYGPTVTFNFYALANDGYSFSYWRKEGSSASASTSNPYAVSADITSASEGNPTQVNYQAVFVKITGLVRVKSADISRGSAIINNPDNGVGDEVKLTALPVEGKGIVLLGWKKEGSDDYLTDGNGYHIEDNSLIFTVTTENQGTYVAYFSDEAEQSYYRIRNKATGKFLCVTGTANAGVHNANIQNRSRQDGYVFTNSLTLVDDNVAAQCNPGTVFKFTGAYVNGNLISTTLSSQGVSLSSLTENHTFTIEPYQGNYRIYTTFKVAVSNSVTITVPSYLCGVSTPTLMSTYSPDFDNSEWELFPLTENSTTQAFGANAQQKYTDGEHYYTSMYAPFPYKLLDGVKAYYLPVAEGVYHQATNTIVFAEVPSSSGSIIVPANTPVILECTNYNGPSSNRLLPLTDDEEIPALPYASLNLLNGYLDLDGDRVTNDHDKMYVFSIYENKLGFYHFNKDYMNPHKAYLKLPMSLSEFEEQYKEKANNAKFAFKFEEPAMIELNNAVVDDADAPVFDLQGRKVKAVKAGVYVKKGKKYVVK